MERYAPKLMELAPRDMVSRAIYQEIRAGRGIDGKDYVYLDVRHLGRKVIEEKLPDITDFARVYQGVEPITEPVPDPADRPLRDGRHPDRPRSRGSPATRPGPSCPGCTRPARRPACRVHGANRLGTNSLVDLLVFGRRAGRQMADGRRRASTMPDVADDAAEPVRAEIEGLRTSTGRETPAAHPRASWPT